VRKTIVVKKHALLQLQERSIPEDVVKDVVRYPGQILESYKGRKIAQDVIKYQNEHFLIRVVFEEHKETMEVVTVYLTKKIKKYWEGSYAH